VTIVPVKTAYDLTPVELGDLMESWGEPAYRTSQILRWLYIQAGGSFLEMTDIPALLRQKLATTVPFTCLKPLEERVSGDGQTRKFLFQLADGQTIEAAIMLYGEAEASRERHTVCISTQVGCAIGCPFCATGRQGFGRNLSAGEILAQILYFMRFPPSTAPSKDKTAPRRPVTNIVFMGMGEPLANYDALWRAVTVLHDQVHIGCRQMTVSTAGMAPQIRRLAGELLHLELAVSLHAPDDALRNRLVPLNRKYPLADLLASCREYQTQTGRRPTMEYALFRGVNDSSAQAQALVRVLHGLNCSVNLIPGNPTSGTCFTPSSAMAMDKFRDRLRQEGISSTLRVPRGQDIEAGCGQLRSRYQDQKA
jgi:23S rRNA (adenine2503-C2)-methyltransferase